MKTAKSPPKKSINNSPKRSISPKESPNKSKRKSPSPKKMLINKNKIYLNKINNSEEDSSNDSIELQDNNQKPNNSNFNYLIENKDKYNNNTPTHSKSTTEKNPIENSNPNIKEIKNPKQLNKQNKSIDNDYSNYTNLSQELESITKQHISDKELNEAKVLIIEVNKY